VPQARRDDPRVTRIGRVLRRTSLDQLPQLLNVLKGEMSPKPTRWRRCSAASTMTWPTSRTGRCYSTSRSCVPHDMPAAWNADPGRPVSDNPTVGKSDRCRKIRQILHTRDNLRNRLPFKHPTA
jgi:hypothetical protein